MKNKLFFAAFLLLSASARGQAGVNINNTSSCAVYVTMYAICPSAGYTAPCSLQSNPIRVLSSASATYPDWSTFQSSVGWTSGAVIPLVPCATCSAITDFQWTDATFTWDCTPLTCNPTSLPGVSSSTISCSSGTYLCVYPSAAYGSTCATFSSSITPCAIGPMVNISVSVAP